MPLRCMQIQAYMPDTPLLCLVLQIANHISCMIVIANGTILSQPQLLLIYASGPPSSLPPLSYFVTRQQRLHASHEQGIPCGICQQRRAMYSDRTVRPVDTIMICCHTEASSCPAVVKS